MRQRGKRASVGSRVGTSVDVGRVAEALSRPGIDASCWLHLGRVDDDPDAVSWVEGTGWLVDVTMHGGKLDQAPSITCRVASCFSSSLEGASCPVKRGSEVVVSFPGDGDPNDSPVIVGQVANASTPVPASIFTSPAPEPIDEAFAERTLFLVSSDDMKLQVGDTFRLDAQASAGLHAPAVTLAEPTAQEPFVRGTQLANALGSFLDATSTMANALSTAFSSAATASTGPLAPLATPFAAMATAINVWKPAISTLKATLTAGQVLSTKIRGE